MRKKLSVLALILVFALSVTVYGSGKTEFDFSKYGVEYIKASDPSNSPETATDRKDTIVFGGALNMTGNFNLLLGDNYDDWYACYVMFDFNIDIDFDGRPIPGATDYSVSKDGLTYTFKIKDGVKFWNGHAATAKDLEFAYYLIADPKYDGPNDITKAYIKGLKEYKAGSEKNIKGIKVIDDKTLQITCSKPSGAAIYNLQIPLLERNYYAPNFKKGDTDIVKMKSSVPMGTGQYKFVKFIPGQKLELVANQNYFKGTPKIKNLRFTTVPEDYELQSLLTGLVDIIMTNPSVDNMNTAQETGFVNILRYPTNGFGYIGLNNTNEKFRDVRVRQALMYALDRKTIVNEVYGDSAKVINIPESFVSWAYNEDGINTYDFNLKKAGQLLDEAGWKLNKNGKREKNGKLFNIKFTCMSPHPVTDILVPVMKDDYAKLGITLDIENLDWPTLYDKATNKKLEAYFMATGLTPDPDAGSTVFKTGASQNYYGYSNPTVDKLYDLGLSRVSAEERKPVYNQIYKTLNRDLPVLYIYQRNDMLAVNARIKGIETSSYREIFYNLYKCEIVK